MIIFSCNVCRTSLSAEVAQAGKLVRCPSCLTTMSVPAMSNGPTPPPRANAAPIGRSGASGSPLGRRYGFNCVYCSSRLEATETMAAQEGQCPTCGSSITIPILDRYGRLIDPITKQIIVPDPHPVHAYAAAGERAPVILRQNDGSQIIKCSKCNAASPINLNNCRQCGMPFTMEGTTPESGGANNGYAVTSLVLGILGIPFACTVIVPLLAIIFGVVAIIQINKQTPGSGKGMPIAGIICGSIGVVFFMMYFFSR